MIRERVADDGSFMRRRPRMPEPQSTTLRRRASSLSSASPSVLFTVVCFLSILQSITARRFLRSHGEPEPIVPVVVEEDEPKTSSISDVWLCMGIAFGWAIFMVRPLFHTSMARYETDGISVQGNVLDSKIDMTGGDTPGIPAYHAMIDYIYEYEGKTFQVRKAFTTDQLLEKGFANVGLLVLPNEPTSGILLNDWTLKYQQEQEEAWVQSRMLYITLLLGGIFVSLSIAGAVIAVQRLPDEAKRTGWICLTAALILLGPAAFAMYMLSQRCTLTTRESIKEGRILQGSNFISTLKVGTCAVDPWGALAGMGESATPRGSNDDQPKRRTHAEKFYFVCMPTTYEKGDNGSVSTVSSISMRSIALNFSADAEASSSFNEDDVGLNAYKGMEAVQQY
jgi:hypothetical protein